MREGGRVRRERREGGREGEEGGREGGREGERRELIPCRRYFKQASHYLVRDITSIKSFLSAASNTLSSVPLSHSSLALIHSLALHSAQ